LLERQMWSSAIPQMLSGYFADLGRVLTVIRPALRRGAPFGFVVSNSAYGGLPVATDLLLCELAALRGYSVDELVVYRGVIPSSQQFQRMIGKQYLRETLVVLRA